MLQEYERSLPYLSRNKVLGAFVRAHGPITFRREHARGVFQSLAESIIYQQLSGKAAATICKRFVALFPGKKFPTPSDVLTMSVARMRGTGLSGQKVSYIKDLALKCTDGTINSRKFRFMSDAAIVEHVVAVKGIGVWTAQMFLMFTLGRPDVLPTGDLGIQKAFQKIFMLRKKPTPAQMEKLSVIWVGHRTLACFYLWRLLDQ